MGVLILKGGELVFQPRTGGIINADFLLWSITYEGLLQQNFSGIRPYVGKVSSTHTHVVLLDDPFSGD